MHFKRTVCGLLAAAMLTATFCGCKKSEVDSADTAIYTENLTITSGMTEYCFNSQYITFLNSTNGYLDEVGLDPTKPLSDQSCTVSTSAATWYDYFMQLAEDKLTTCAVVYEDAVKNGKQLSDKEKQNAAKIIEEIEKAAKTEELSKRNYIAENYGKNVTEEDIIRCAELDMLVQKYYSEYSKTVDTDDLALEKYLLNHKKTYCTVDYIYFSIPAEDETQGAMLAAKEVASQMLTDTTEEKLLKEIESYAENYYAKKESLKGKELKARVAEVRKQCIVTDVPYSSSEAAVWAFADERKLHDTKVVENTTNNTVDIYYLTTLPKRKDYQAVTMRQLQFKIADYGDSAAAEKAAKACLAALKEAEFSAESFENAENANTADEETVTLYENIKKGDLTLSVPEIENWLFDSSRKQGDSAVIKTEALGWHVVYLESFGEYAWKTEIRSDMLSRAFESYTDDLGDETMLHKNSNIIYAITESDQSKNYASATE